MTDQTDPEQSTRTRIISEDNTHGTPDASDFWDREEQEQTKPSTSPISDPPDHGVNYYNRLINLDNFSYTYIRSESNLGFKPHGRITDLNEFRAAVYQLYRSAHNSELPAADFRAKAFWSFASHALSADLESTIQMELGIAPEKPHNVGQHTPVEKLIIDIMYETAYLGCKDRTQLNGMKRTKDSVLRTVLPDDILHS
jgi:hypothetical protein